MVVTIKETSLTEFGEKCVFIPELRKSKFGSVDPRYFQTDIWNIESTKLDLGDRDDGTPFIMFEVDISRRWRSFLGNNVIFMFVETLFGLSVFALRDTDNVGQRLKFSITAIICLIFSMYGAYGSIYIASAGQYLTLFDKYVLSCFLYLFILVIETAIKEYLSSNSEMVEYIDRIFFYFMIYVFIGYHNIFLFFAVRGNHEEEEVLLTPYDQAQTLRKITPLTFFCESRLKDSAHMLTYQAPAADQK